MEANPRWHGGYIVVNHRKHVQIGQVEGQRDWDFSDLVVANVKHFKSLVFWSADLSDLNESVLVKMELLEPGQKFADGRDCGELVAIQAEVAEVVHPDLILLDLFTSSTISVEEM